MRRAKLIRRSAVAAAAAALLVLFAVPAFGSEPWSASQTVPGGYLARWDTPTGGVLHTSADLFGFTPGGAGYAVLGDDKGGQGFTVFDASTGAFRPLRSSTFGGVKPALMAAYGREQVILAGGASAPADRRSPLNADVLLDAAATRGTVGGGFSIRQVLARGVITHFRGSVRTIEPATVTALAANPAGDAAVVVAVPVRGHISVLGFRSRLFVRRHGQSTFRKVADIGARTVGRSPAVVAVNGSGDVLVAWDDRQSVRARVVSAGGHLGTEQRLGRGGSAWVGASRMAASIDGTHRMLVAWLAQRVGEGNYAGSPGIVAYAYASPHKPFAAAKVVQSGLPKGFDRGIGAPGVQATLLRTDAVVVWTGYSAGRFTVRSVNVTSGRPSAPVDLSPAGADASLQGSSVGPAGGVVVAWASSARSGTTPAPPPGVYARVRPAGATTWGALETITTMVGGDFVPGGVPLAANPVTGQAVVLWSDPVTAAFTPAPLTTHSSVRRNPDLG
jgi:hypothetical protein